MYIYIYTYMYKHNRSACILSACATVCSRMQKQSLAYMYVHSLYKKKTVRQKLVGKNKVKQLQNSPMIGSHELSSSQKQYQLVSIMCQKRSTFVSFVKGVREQCTRVSSAQNIGIPIFSKENALICIPRADKKCAKRGLSCAKRGLSS